VGKLLAREVGLGPLLVRLGVVVACLLALVVLVVQGRHLLTAHAPVDPIRAGPTALDRHTTKSASSTPLVRALAAQSGSPADNAAPDMRDRFDAGFAIQPALNADYVEAARLMIPPPPQTELGLQGVDPRFLRDNFQRGVTAMNGDVEDQIATGARRVSVAAILGYKPARMLIAQRYPSSAILRSAVKSAEAIRYSLDPLFTPGAQSVGNRNFLVLLAAYFSGHQALSNYADDLLAALGDDPRLQTGERLELLLKLLARVRGACTAIAMAVAKARTITGPECSPGLQSHIANYLKATPPPGLEAESRRQGFQLLDNVDITRPLAQSPARD
jgi:hypothetical protein